MSENAKVKINGLKEKDSGSESILKVENLNVHFFTRRGEIEAIRGLNFNLRKGEILGIVGESGSGKSVTALSIIDLLPSSVGAITAGNVILEDKVISDLYKREYKLKQARNRNKISRRRVPRRLRNEIQNIRGRISMIFQDPLTSLDPLYKVKAQMLESILFNNSSMIIRRILEKADLKKNKNDLVDSLPQMDVKEFTESIRELFGDEGFYQELLLISNSGLSDSDKKVRITKSIDETGDLDTGTMNSLRKQLKSKRKKVWKPKNSKKFRSVDRAKSPLLREALLYSYELLEFVDMPHPEKIMDSYPHELSGGMKQRIMIVLAIANKPDILIADEPTTALDVITQYQILYLLKTLNSKLGLTFIFITHDLGVMAAIADRILVMYAGKVSEIGPTNLFLNDPLHPYTQGLLKSIPSKSGGTEGLYTIPGTVPDLLNPPDGCAFANRCSYVKQKCLISEPPKIEYKGREVHCWLYEGENDAK